MIELSTTNWDIFACRGNPLLITFYTDVEQNCKPLIRKLEVIESEYPDIIFCKCDGSNNTALANRYYIEDVPSVLLLDGLKPQVFLSNLDSIKKGLDEHKEGM